TNIRVPALAFGRWVECPRCGTGFAASGEPAQEQPAPTEPSADSYELPRSGLPAGAIAIAVAAVLGVVLLVIVVVAANQGADAKAPQAGNREPSGRSQASSRVDADADTQHISPGAVIVIVLIVVIGVALYLVPSIIAFSRGHQNSAAILALNVLLGFIFIGWVA